MCGSMRLRLVPVFLFSTMPTLIHLMGVNSSLSDDIIWETLAKAGLAVAPYRRRDQDANDLVLGQRRAVIMTGQRFVAARAQERRDKAEAAEHAEQAKVDKREAQARRKVDKQAAAEEKEQKKQAKVAVKAEKERKKAAAQVISSGTWLAHGRVFILWLVDDLTRVWKRFVDRQTPVPWVRFRRPNGTNRPPPRSTSAATCSVGPDVSRVRATAGSNANIATFGAVRSVIVVPFC